MTVQVAEAAVDYLLENCSNYARVTFFGGEPLLEFELIKHITCYIEKKAKRTVNLDIVTNGTLLNDEILCFAHDNNIHIGVSYDGLLNDTNRVNEDGNPVLVIDDLTDVIMKFKMSSLSVIDVNNVNIWHKNVLRLKELGFKAMNFFIDYQSHWKAEHVKLLRREFFKIADSYIQWAKNGDKIDITKIDDMVAAYSSKFGLSKTKVNRDFVYSISVNGDVYPYASAVGNENLNLGNVVSGMNQERLEKVNNLGFVKGCEKCPINDACVAAMGNNITDELEPIAFPIACHGYKIAFDVADLVVNELLKKY